MAPFIQPESNRNRTTEDVADFAQWRSARRIWSEIETDRSLINSRIDNFVRLKKNSRIRSKIDRVIQSEMAYSAMLESTKSLKRAPKNLRTDPNAIVFDPVVGSMHFAKTRIARAYRRLDECNEKLLLTERSRYRLAWDSAQMSSIPGLIRLVGAELDTHFSADFVKAYATDPSVRPRISNEPSSIPSLALPVSRFTRAAAPPATHDTDSAINHNPDSLDADTVILPGCTSTERLNGSANILRGRPKVFVIPIPTKIEPQQTSYDASKVATATTDALSDDKTSERK